MVFDKTTIEMPFGIENTKFKVYLYTLPGSHVLIPDSKYEEATILWSKF